MIVPALLKYKELHGDDMLVPVPSFAVPSSEAWPKEVWGMRLGRAVNNIRSKD